jgi:hypothetical protein
MASLQLPCKLPREESCEGVLLLQTKATISAQEDAEGQRKQSSGIPSSPHKNGTIAAAFYVSKMAGKAGCRLAPVPLTRSSFNVHYNDNHLRFDAAEGKPPVRAYRPSIIKHQER